MFLGVFADEPTLKAASDVANTSLVVSLCTLVVVPLVTMLVQKYFENKRHDAESMLAKAKLEADAAVQKAKLELDSELLVIKEQHAECTENTRRVQHKLEECEKQHQYSAQQHEESAQHRAALESKTLKLEEELKRFEDVFARSAARGQAQAEKTGDKPSG